MKIKNENYGGFIISKNILYEVIYAGYMIMMFMLDFMILILKKNFLLLK